MSSETIYALKKFKEALSRLKQGVKQADNDLAKDGVIQRFEFTFELMWKALKIFLEKEGIVEKTPKGCLKEAFRIDWIEDEQEFLSMLEDRNKTTHIYSKEESKKIFDRIEQNHLNALSALAEKLGEKISF